MDPRDAGKHAAIVATGRSDYPNQINNVLVFPGLFRGMLDAGAARIDDEMLRAAAVAVADVVTDGERNSNYIIPGVFDSRVVDRGVAGGRGACDAFELPVVRPDARFPHRRIAGGQRGDST